MRCNATAFLLPADVLGLALAERKRACQLPGAARGLSTPSRHFHALAYRQHFKLPPAAADVCLLPPSAATPGSFCFERFLLAAAVTCSSGVLLLVVPGNAVFTAVGFPGGHCLLQPVPTSRGPSAASRLSLPAIVAAHQCSWYFRRHPHVTTAFCHPCARCRNLGFRTSPSRRYGSHGLPPVRSTVPP